MTDTAITAAQVKQTLEIGLLSTVMAMLLIAMTTP
jgi:hypothetical protein